MNTRAAYRAPARMGNGAATCPVQQVWPGPASPETTLPRMVDMVLREYTDPAVIETATAIALRAPEKDPGAIAAELLSWLRVHTHFIPDPLEQQQLTAPTCALLRIGADGVAGLDCVDVAMLAAALARAVSLEAAFIAEGYEQSPAVIVKQPCECMHKLTHVYAIVETPAGWVQLDTQQPRDVPNLAPVAHRIIVSIP